MLMSDAVGADVEVMMDTDMEYVVLMSDAVGTGVDVMKQQWMLTRNMWCWCRMLRALMLLC